MAQPPIRPARGRISAFWVWLFLGTLLALFVLFAVLGWREGPRARNPGPGDAAIPNPATGVPTIPGGPGDTRR